MSYQKEQSTNVRNGKKKKNGQILWQQSRQFFQLLNGGNVAASTMSHSRPFRSCVPCGTTLLGISPRKKDCYNILNDTSVRAVMRIIYSMATNQCQVYNDEASACILILCDIIPVAWIVSSLFEVQH